MIRIEHQDSLGRKYSAFTNGGKDVIIIGPPENLVDELHLPEPIATQLHNVLYARGLFTYKEAAKGSNLIAALQEALLVDAQILLEAYHKYESR